MLALAGCAREEPRVDARDYDAFWLWAGVKPQPVLAKAKTVYLLEGEVRDSPVPRLERLRGGTPRARHAKLWIVYRVETLRWGADIPVQINADIVRWRKAGANVEGVQIDFDAATSGLSGYATFMKGLRGRLPADCKLGVTGLLDWSAQGDPTALNQLAGAVDEIVIQTYQGRETVPGYEAYMDGLTRLHVPFKVGLAQGGKWRAPPSLMRNRNFKGYVVFLLNEKPDPEKPGPAS